MTLDLFTLVGVPAGVRVPDSGSILDSRPDICYVGYVRSMFGARPQVPGKKSTTTVSSFADGVNMVAEGQLRVDVHTKKFSRVYFLQCLDINCVRCLDWFPLECYTQYLALVWDELHEPCIHPLLQSACIMLEDIIIIT